MRDDVHALYDAIRDRLAENFVAKESVAWD
jgi:hypothetical protein